jgi:hypothetical protein
MPGTLNTNVTQTLQTTQSLQQQVGTVLNNTLSDVQYNLGGFIQNINYIPFIPTVTIKFMARGLKPNTRLYAYFGDVPVSGWCAPITDIENYNTDNIADSKLTDPFGTPLYSDEYGNCNGVFKIPPNKFPSHQETQFVLNDISDLTEGMDAIKTQADGVYYASAFSVGRANSLLNTRQTVLSSSEVTQNQIVTGLAVQTVTTQDYVPDPPPRSGGGGGCGCGCFTGNTLVMLESGKEIPIKDIKIGDRVFNSDMSQINTVKYVETIDGSNFEYFYSPTSAEPFATSNHPLYMNGKLHSADPDLVNNYHPWFGMTEKFVSFKAKKATSETVYNLWCDGDNTYTVNGLGTTSIMKDGGVLRVWAEKNILTNEELNSIMINYMASGKEAMYGAYILINTFAMIKNDKILKILADAVLNEKLATKRIAKMIGKVACIIKSPSLELNKYMKQETV